MHYEFSRMGKVFFSLCKSIDTPRSLGAWLRFKHNQLALAEMDLNPSDYLSAEAFFRDYVVVSFLSKWKGLDTKLDLEAVALQKLIASEAACRETNARIRLSRKSAIDADIASVIYTARRKIARLLGPYSKSHMLDRFGWGPGATNDLLRSEAFIDTKVSKLPISVTSGALPLIREVIQDDLHWSSAVLGVSVTDITQPYCLLDSVFLLTETCTVDTVPKNAKTHRVIAKEPRANGFLQKGFGSYIRSQLKRVGVNLDDQSRNQDGARRAHNDRLATLDLRAASDSMSIELVYELLPVDWALALDEVRSKRALLPDGTVLLLEKFSSMGNGFTFELESLIFWAVVRSVADAESPGSEVLVYGDDLICQSAIADRVVQALNFIGFQINEEKSFITGQFYESCGKHYFGGIDVTPIYQKEQIEEASQLIRAANRVIRLASKHSAGWRLYQPFESTWRTYLTFSRGSLHRQIPLGAEGDDGWLLPASYFRVVSHDINLGMRCRVIRLRKTSFPACPASLLAWTLRRGVVTESPYGDQVTSSPDTTVSTTLSEGWRWVMPTWEFGLDW